MSTTDTTLTIVGNLTADPELAYTPTGTGYARFSIAATPRRYDKATDQWVDGETLFLRCVAWRDLAEHVAESLHKGTRVLASGLLRQSNWETGEGEKRTSIDLHVEEIGPSLRFATAKVAKAARDSGRDEGRPAPADPWATPSATPAPSGDREPAAAGSVPGFDEPPF